MIYVIHTKDNQQFIGHKKEIKYDSVLNGYYVGGESLFIPSANISKFVELEFKIPDGTAHLSKATV